MRTNSYIVVMLLCLLVSRTAQAQEEFFFANSMVIHLDSAEHIFLQNNLLVLAQKYNVAAQKALIIQAKMLPNPNFSYSLGPLLPINDPNYNSGVGTTATAFHDNENQIAVSQLILLAGKRNKQIKLAVANTKLAEYQFFDLIRTLKYTLRTDFFNLYYLQQSAKAYTIEIKTLQEVINTFSQQEGKGYISQKEVLRIKAQLYSLQSEYNVLINQINDIESELRLILQVKQVYIVPQVDTGLEAKLIPTKYSLATLIDTAYVNRTDLQISKMNTDISQLNYDYQRSLAIPDVTASWSYDQQGNFARQFQALGVAIDLPFFNRNQGNIKSAKWAIEASKVTQQNAVATVEEQITRALQKAFDNHQLYENIDSTFATSFDKLLQEVTANYHKRNLGLLEFLDFYNSYKQNILQINAVKFNRISAFEDLNFYTGTNFFN